MESSFIVFFNNKIAISNSTLTVNMKDNAKDWTFASAHTIATAIVEKRLSALEILDHYIGRIESFDEQINAVVVRDFDRARDRARAADQEIAAGRQCGPLHGVPMTIKEAFDVEGLPTTWGFDEHRNNIAERNAVAVQRFSDAGANLLGKTNVPVALADWQSFNPIYGTTNNPWDVQRTPGGSSGGSAAALAAGFTALEAGSDIGASIRNPAHYCGIYGHKTSFGIATSEGHSLPQWRGSAEVDIAVIGPMARSAADLEIALDVMAGPDAIDGSGWTLNLPRPKAKSLADFKVGIVYSDTQAEVDQSVQNSLRELARFLNDAGVQVFEERRPDIDSRAAHETYIALLRSATSSGVSESDFERFKDKADKLNSGADDYASLMYRGVTLSHREWCFVNEIRHRSRRAWAEYFEDIDLFLCPAATTTAFPHNQQGERWQRMIDVNGQPQPTTTALFWAGYSGHVYLPSTVAPVGLSESGLPVGVQIVGPQYHDHCCIRFAQLLEKEFRAFSPPPALI